MVEAKQELRAARLLFLALYIERAESDLAEIEKQARLLNLKNVRKLPRHVLERISAEVTNELLL